MQKTRRWLQQKTTLYWVAKKKPKRREKEWAEARTPVAGEALIQRKVSSAAERGEPSREGKAIVREAGLQSSTKQGVSRITTQVR